MSKLFLCVVRCGGHSPSGPAHGALLSPITPSASIICAFSSDILDVFSSDILDVFISSDVLDVVFVSDCLDVFISSNCLDVVFVCDCLVELVFSDCLDVLFVSDFLDDSDDIICLGDCLDVDNRMYFSNSVILRSSLR